VLLTWKPSPRGLGERNRSSTDEKTKVPNWKRIVDDFFRMSDPDGEYEHYAPKGATAATIAELESEIGVELPQELRDFYANYNGIGLVTRDEEAPMPLFIRPTTELPGFIRECQSIIRDTHPNHAERYFPFIDWYNGDSSGFMLNAKGQLVDGVFTFSHELYSYDAAQDLNDFIQPHSDSIASLLSPN
jgi:hypothetical protein